MSVVSISNLVHTLRHLRPWQVVGRIVAPIRRRLAAWRVPNAPTELTPSGTPQTRFPQHDPWNTRNDVQRGRFQFLNETAELGRPVDWGAGSMPLLWRFNLHYFHYLHDLTRDEQARSAGNG